MSVGMPESLKLQEFGQLVWDAFGEIPYHVGSSMGEKKPYRDVDVRVMLSDEEYEKQGYGNVENPHDNAKWCAMVLAFSELGRQMTGLPIDFQIQQTSNANKLYSSDEKHYRSALFSMKKAHPKINE
jgi:hypothetical protein